MATQAETQLVGIMAAKTVSIGGSSVGANDSDMAGDSKDDQDTYQIRMDLRNISHLALTELPVRGGTSAKDEDGDGARAAPAQPRVVKYRWNWNLLIAAVLSGMNWYAFFTDYQAAAVATCCAVLALCAAAAVYGRFCHESRNLNEYFNALLNGGFEREGLYANDIRASVGLAQLILLSYSLVVTILARLLQIATDTDGDSCDAYSDYEDLTRSERDACIVWKSGSSNVYVLTFCVAQLVFLKELTQGFEDRLAGLKRRVFGSHPCTRDYDAAVVRALRDFKGSLEVGRTKKLQFAGLCALFTVIHCVLYGVVRHKLYDNLDTGYYSAWSMALCHVLFVADAVVAAMAVSMIGVIAQQCQFPSVIVGALSDALLEDLHAWAEFDAVGARPGVGFVAHLLGWWALRRHYVWGVIHYRTRRMSVIMGTFLGGAAVPLAFVFAYDLNSVTLTMSVIGSAIILAAALTVAALLAQYTEGQVGDVATINKVQMQFNVAKFYAKAHRNKAIAEQEQGNARNYSRDYALVFSDLNEIYGDVDNMLNEMCEDARGDVHAVRVFGIGINLNFIMALRALVAGVGIAVLSEII